MTEITDWDDAYDNAGHVPDGTSYGPRWAEEAAAYRAQGGEMELDVAYGQAPRQMMDLFYPKADAQGVAMFVHGGYWMKFDKSYWSHLAEGARAKGWIFAIPSYTLAPEARIADMTQEIGRAADYLAERFEGGLHLAGHSAGGHLVSRMACRDHPMKQATAARVVRVLSISGLHDLGPLQKTKLNETLNIDEVEAKRESAALLQPREGVDVAAWVGEDERPEFLRQSALLREAWRAKGAKVSLTVATGRHHMDVIAPLSDPTSPLTQAWVGLA
ncbi:MAG: alpha/beta hydrolase [Pseudomonadota bacterium]